MRFTAEVADLADPLGTAFAACAARTPHPALRAVRCVAGPGGLALTGSDGERAVTVPAPAAVGRAGECLLPDRLLAACKLAGGRVEVEAAGDGLEARFAAGALTFPWLDPAGYPAPPAAPACPHEVPAGALARALDRVAFAAARDEGRYAIRAVCWEAAGGMLEVAASDGKRLAVAAVGPAGGLAGRWLVPPAAVAILRRLLGACDPAAGVGVGLTDAAAHFRAPTGAVYSRLVDGRFPDYRGVLPTAFATRVGVDGPGFLEAVRLAALAADADARRVTLAVGPDAVGLAATGAETGRASVRYAHASFAGEPVGVAFDPALLLDAGRALAGPATLGLNGPAKAGVFEYDGGLLLVVPLA